MAYNEKTTLIFLKITIEKIFDFTFSLYSEMCPVNIRKSHILLLKLLHFFFSN